MVQEELLRLAKREREATSDSMNVTLQREKDSTNEEKQKADHLVSGTVAHPSRYISISSYLPLGSG